MKLHNFRFAPLAERDLEQIQDILADQYPERDIKFMAKLDKLIEQLRMFPKMGRTSTRFDQCRSIVIWDFVMLYRVDEAMVTIERVIHGARDLKSLFDDE
jgi:toxin ParE1/3/4